jgi:hypothetical protein
MVDAASQAGENLVQAAGEAAQHLKDDAAARGMTPEGVKQMARAATDTFSKSVAGARERNTGAAPEATAFTELIRVIDIFCALRQESAGKIL